MLMFHPSFHIFLYAQYPQSHCHLMARNFYLIFQKSKPLSKHHLCATLPSYIQNNVRGNFPPLPHLALFTKCLCLCSNIFPFSAPLIKEYAQCIAELCVRNRGYTALISIYANTKKFSASGTPALISSQHTLLLHELRVERRQPTYTIQNMHLCRRGARLSQLLAAWKDARRRYFQPLYDFDSVLTISIPGCDWAQSLNRSFSSPLWFP